MTTQVTSLFFNTEALLMCIYVCAWSYCPSFMTCLCVWLCVYLIFCYALFIKRRPVTGYNAILFERESVMMLEVVLISLCWCEADTQDVLHALPRTHTFTSTQPWIHTLCCMHAGPGPLPCCWTSSISISCLRYAAPPSQPQRVFIFRTS